MARSKSTFLVPLVGALVLAGPALAQFNNVFRNDPAPVPPADVPYSPPVTGQGRDPGRYQRDYQNYPPDRPLPPADVPRADMPPAQPLPAPMSLPPQRRPGGGVIESQPLAPPPGTEPGNQARVPARAQPQQAQPGGPAPGQPGQVQPGQAQPGQAQPAETRQPAQAAPARPPTNEVVIAPPPQRIANPTAVFEGLDKITGRTTTFDVAINETVQFGALQVTPKVCYSRPPTETPQTDAFVDVDEVTLKGKIRRIFTGWMFAASPGLNAVEHPIYDVWLANCKGGKNPAMADASADQGAEADKEASKNSPKHAEKPAPKPKRRPQARAPRTSPGFLPALR